METRVLGGSGLFVWQCPCGRIRCPNEPLIYYDCVRLLRDKQPYQVTPLNAPPWGYAGLLLSP